MNIIIGINANHADSSAVLFIDNELIFGIEEERLNRIKHWSGFPENSIRECLKYVDKYDIQEIDVAINTNIFSNIKEKVYFTFKNYIFGQKKSEIYKRIKKKLNLKNLLHNKFSKYKFNIHYIDHHLSHIASSFYPSKFKKSYALSVDGFGDFCSIVLAKCEDDEIKITDRLYYPNSLGVFYEGFTQLLGFRNYGDEYKVMGLSSYGKPIYSDKISKEIFDDSIFPKLNLKYFNHQKKEFKYIFEGQPKQNIILNNNIYNIFNKDEININKNFNYVADLASSIQKVYEEKLKSILENKIDKSYSQNLVLSGGCALNSLCNGKIMESNKFNNLFVPYSPGDAGGAIGASLYVLSKKKKYKTFNNIQNPYIGSEYSTETILRILKNYDCIKFDIVKFENENEIYSEVSKLLLESKVVGWFKGKMEFGPRSLGNRAILANPTINNMKEIINGKIKKRESFRPFAPVILYEEKSKWFKTNCNNPYMSFVETILPERRDRIPAVTHIDGTGRVQTIAKDQNPKLYALIKEFYKISKVPILLNTSFNENEPIVENPIHAIDCFNRTDMDALVLENILLKKK